MARYKGVNYLKQRKEGYCVAISIVNALKWSGASKVSEKNLDYIYKKAGKPGSDEGTKKTSVDKALKLCKKYFRTKYTKHPKYSTLREWLKKGNAFILDYFHGIINNHEVGHSVFVLYDSARNKFVVINDFGKTINYVSTEDFKKMLKKTKHYHTGYFIRKSREKNKG